MKRYQTNAIVRWDPSITNCSVNDEIEKINVLLGSVFSNAIQTMTLGARSVSRLNTLNLFWARWSCGARSSITEILISFYGKLFEQSFELNSTHFYFVLFFQFQFTHWRHQNGEQPLQRTSWARRKFKEPHWPHHWSMCSGEKNRNQIHSTIDQSDRSESVVFVFRTDLPGQWVEIKLLAETCVS